MHPVDKGASCRRHGEAKKYESWSVPGAAEDVGRLDCENNATGGTVRPEVASIQGEWTVSDNWEGLFARNGARRPRSSLGLESEVCC